jgi:tetratricopeptide (TPR) repeat protein
MLLISWSSLAAIFLTGVPVAPGMALPKSLPLKLPITGLPPAKVFPNFCVYHYRVTTTSAECQTFVDQAYGCYYSYVWMEAARSFETAIRHDPNCAMAWLGLSRAQERWGKGDATVSLKKAKELMTRADDRERALITARLQEKGLTEGVTPDTRRSSARKTIDELLVLYDDDQEAWYYRAELADGPEKIPYFKALLRLNPLHPGANHELVHYYENIRRPALGFPYAEKYIESSPGIPHPFHMQAHLATRLGRWDKTSDRSARAVELERNYHKFMNVKPSEDHQFSHHLEILTISLIHDGRFAEARKIKDEAQKAGSSHWMPWYRLHVAERDWVQVEKIIEHHRKRDKQQGAYMAALMYLHRGEIKRAEAEVDALRQAQRGRRDRRSEDRLNEVQGLLSCASGSADEGLKLLQRVVDKTKNDFSHHAWGNGAYYMEVWGMAALKTGRLLVAEEAMLEALAHDPGSVRGALGMQALCEKQGRTAEAAHFGKLAQKFWRRADLEHFIALKDEFAKAIPSTQSVTNPTGTRTGGEE